MTIKKMNLSVTKICIFTSTRADYGILSPLIKRMVEDPMYQVRVFATGTHFLRDHGYTLDEILQDRIDPYYKVPIEMSIDNRTSHLTTMSNALVSFAESLSQDRPDVALVLGDRFEALSFGIAANGLGIPLIHLHGGEVTEGALDDAYRHCLTKLSNLHFVAAEKYRERVIRMGESPETVFNVGALGIDNVRSAILLTRSELESDLSFRFKSELIAVTYHPETTNPFKDKDQVAALLEALEKKISAGQSTVVITRANADSGNQEIHEMVRNFVDKYKDNCLYVHSLGMKRYLSLLKLADVVAGNSSSGIIEAPALGTPTVDIGDRQNGREIADSIFKASGKSQDIYMSIEKAIAFKKVHQGKSFSIFGSGNTAEKIHEVLRRQTFTPYPKKEFFNGLEKI